MSCLVLLRFGKQAEGEREKFPRVINDIIPRQIGSIWFDLDGWQFSCGKLNDRCIHICATKVAQPPGARKCDSLIICWSILSKSHVLPSNSPVTEQISASSYTWMVLGIGKQEFPFMHMHRDSIRMGRCTSHPSVVDVNRPVCIARHPVVELVDDMKQVWMTSRCSTAHIPTSDGNRLETREGKP